MVEVNNMVNYKVITNGKKYVVVDEEKEPRNGSVGHIVFSSDSLIHARKYAYKHSADVEEVFRIYEHGKTPFAPLTLVGTVVCIKGRPCWQAPNEYGRARPIRADGALSSTVYTSITGKRWYTADGKPLV